MTRWLPLVALLTALPASADGVLARPFEAQYALESRGMLVGETHWKLERTGDGIVWESLSEAAGVATLLGENRISERSVWQAHSEGMRPASYRYERVGRREKLVSIAFDWQAGVVYNTAGGDTWRMDVPAGTMDKLGYLLALMEDLAEGRRSVTYDIADGGKLKQYRLDVTGEETLETELGHIATLKVERNRPDTDRETTIWMAPSLGYVPVRVEHREPDGESLTMTIRSVNPPAP